MARKPSILHPAAEHEAAREVRHYQRAAGMGGAFLDALAAALEQACEAPERGSPVGVMREETVRSVRLRGFPFRLIYVERPTLIRVLAIAHKSRRLRYWSRRS